MSGNVKGITIEFRGDTTKLDKALRQINNETRSIDKELKQVDKALKFNPTSVELWRQKQQLLTQKIEETKTKLDTLKQAQAKMDAAGVDKNSEEYRNLQREIIVTENQVKTFEAQLRKVGNVSLRAASEQVKEIGNTLTSAGEAMRGLSTAAAGVVVSLGAISYKAGQNADDLNTLSKVYSINTTDLQKYKVAADLVDVSVEDIAKSHVKLEKSMYSAQSGSASAVEAFDKLGVSITNQDGSLRDSDSVWQDAISALGSMTNETERDAIAMQLMGKSAANLNPLIEDNGETYKNLSETLSKYGLDFVDQETLDKANEFNDELDTMKAIGTVALSTVGSQLAATLAPALEKVVDLVGRFAEWLGNLNPAVLTTIGVIAVVVAAVAPVLIVLGKLAFAVSSIMSLVATIGPVIGGVLAMAGPIVAAIAAIIAIGVLLYKNWDEIKAKAIEVKDAVVAKWNELTTNVTTTINTLKTMMANAWNTIKSTASSVWSAIKGAIVTPIQNAKDKVKSILDKVKSFFPIKVGDLFGHINLPHFNISWESLGKTKIKIPKFNGISWYAEGGIFDAPTIAGLGDVRGGEAAVPLDQFWKKMDKIAENASGSTVINININGTNKDPKEIAEEVKRILIKETNQRRLAWQ